MNAEQGFQLDLIGALRRRGLLIAGITGGIFLLGYWVAMALPNQYRAYSTLLVEPQAVSGRLVESGAGETRLNDRLHLMTAEILSRPRLSKVIDDLDLYRDESKTMTRDQIIDLMREKVKVVPLLPELEQQLRTRREIEINTFRIEFTAKSPPVAAQVVAQLANDFIEEHISDRVDVTQKSLTFISREQETLSQAIAEIENEVAAVKDRNPGSLPEDLDANQRLLERALGALRAAQREHDVASSDASFWANQSAEAGLIGGGVDASPEARIRELEAAIDNMQARGFTEKHPDLIVARQEIAELRATIAAGAQQDASDSPANYAQRTAMAEQERARVRVANAEAEIARLQKEVEVIQERIAKTPRVAEQLESLERQHRNLTENLRDFNNRRLEAEVQAQLERRQLGEQFRVLEPAFPPREPASPNRSVILAVALLMGLSLGLAAAVVAETSDTSVHASSELQKETGIPVLAAIPSIRLAPDIAVQRRRRWRLLAATVAVVVVCLVGGFVTYRVVNGSPAGSAAEGAATGGAGSDEAGPGL